MSKMASRNVLWASRKCPCSRRLTPELLMERAAERNVVKELMFVCCSKRCFSFFCESFV